MKITAERRGFHPLVVTLQSKGEVACVLAALQERAEAKHLSCHSKDAAYELAEQLEADDRAHNNPQT